MKQRTFIFYLILGLHSTIYSQSDGQPRVSLDKLIPKSPQAAELFKVNDITVNSAKGAPNISFNLYTATVGNLKIPITLRYDATGIKYDDVPSAVGLKWSLNAGGQISRNINGKPDEDYYFPNQNKMSQDNFNTWNYSTDSAQTYFTNVAQNTYDIAHDDYSYNYLDKSGYFYWRKTKWWDAKTPYTFKIETDSLYYIKKTRITDEFGNIAYFGYGNEEASMPSYGGNGYVSPNIPPFGRTAVYLAKLKAYTKQEATFEYDTVSYSYDQLLSQTYVKKHEANEISSYNCNCGTSNMSESILSNLFSAMVIKKITTPNEEVQFYYGTDNTLGVYKRKLDSITVKDKNSVVINRFRLKYGKYSTSNYLRLDEIWNFSTVGDSLLVAAFHYNATNVSGVNTSARDIFNYNNGANNSNTIISNSDADFTYFYTSADRSVNSSYVNIGNIDTIYYPTGGKTTFYFSPNASGNYYAPGVKVDSIRYLNNDNNIASQINYSYTGLTNGYYFSGYVNNTVTDNGNINCPLKTFSSEIYISPGTPPPSSFYYTNVEIRKKGADSAHTQLIKENYTAEYGCYGNYSPILASKIYCRNNNVSDTLQIETNTYNSLVVDSIGVDELVSGVPGNPYLPSQFYELDGYWVDNTNSCNLFYGFGPGRKAILEPRSYVLASATIKIYDQKISSQTLSTTITSTYNDKWQKISDSKLNSKGNLDSTYYTYLHTNPGSLSSTLTTANLYGLIYKTTRFTNSNVQLDQLRVSFSSHNGLVLPDSFLTKRLSNPENFEQNISAYDTSGGIIEIESKKDFYTSLIKDHNNELIIAEISNARLSNVAYTSFEADGKGNWSYSGSTSIHPSSPTGTRGYSLVGGNITKSGLSSGITYTVTFWKKDSTSSISLSSGSGSSLVTKNGWILYSYELTGTTSLTISGTAYIDELRLYPKGAMMKTYAYQPLIGLSGECDVNNRIIYYQYDDFGRLKRIKDEDGKIVKLYDYKYQVSY